MKRHQIGGLSPHRRGDQPQDRLRGWWRGSIPAQAGEPQTPLSTLRQTRVYPRTGGGTMSSSPPTSASMGLSPHRRGNQGLGPLLDSAHGSIPAQAGEPLMAK